MSSDHDWRGWKVAEAQASDTSDDTMLTAPTTDAPPDSGALTCAEWEQERAGDVACPRCGALVECPRCADWPRLQLVLNRELAQLREDFNREAKRADALAYYLRIYEHAHTTGNSVPLSVVREARAALPTKGGG